jgi:hypothetical protein
MRYATCAGAIVSWILLGVVGPGAAAQDRLWFGGTSGAWGDAGNWSPFGLPTAGQDIDLVPDNDQLTQIAFDTTTPVLGTLRVGTDRDALLRLTQNSGALLAGTCFVGRGDALSGGLGSYLQLGGTADFDELWLAGSTLASGAYGLANDAVLDTAPVGCRLAVGGGAAAFSQQGGTHTTTRLSVYGSSFGTQKYLLAGGVLTGESLFVDFNAEYEQTGGEAFFDTSVSLSGAFRISGGTLESASLRYENAEFFGGQVSCGSVLGDFGAVGVIRDCAFTFDSFFNDGELEIDSGAVLEGATPTQAGELPPVLFNEGVLVLQDEADPGNPPIVNVDVVNSNRLAYAAGDLAGARLENEGELVLSRPATLTVRTVFNRGLITLTSGQALKCLGPAEDGATIENGFGGGIVVDEGQLDVGLVNTLANTAGAVAIDGVVLGNVDNQAEWVVGTPSVPTGTCLITGDYAAAAGSVTAVALADIAAGPAGQLLVFGEAALDGVLRVTFPEGLPSLAEGETFTLVSAGSRSGTFAAHALPPGYRWQVEYVGGDVVLTVGERTGDLNCDGVVDFFDIDPFVTALVDPAGYAAVFPGCDRRQGDVNDDGMVDFFDIDAFVELLLSV